MQAELVDQRLLDFLVHDQESVDFDGVPAIFEMGRQMAVDVDRLAIHAVAREVGDVVAAVELLHAAQDGVECAIQHQAGHEPVRRVQLCVRCVGVAGAIEVHGCAPWWPRAAYAARVPSGRLCLHARARARIYRWTNATSASMPRSPRFLRDAWPATARSPRVPACRAARGWWAPRCATRPTGWNCRGSACCIPTAPSRCPAAAAASANSPNACAPKAWTCAMAACRCTRSGSTTTWTGRFGASVERGCLTVRAPAGLIRGS